MSSSLWRTRWRAVIANRLGADGYSSREELRAEPEARRWEVYHAVRRAYDAERSGWAYDAWLSELRRLRADLGIQHEADRAREKRLRSAAEARVRTWTGHDGDGRLLDGAEDWK